MKDIYIITTSDLPNNVILGHASFAKSAGFNPIFVFPDRGHGDKYLKYYNEYTVIQTKTTFSNKNIIYYFLSLVNLIFGVTRCLLFKKNIKYVLAVDFEGIIASIFLKLRFVKIASLINDNFSVRYNLNFFVFNLLRFMESLTYKLFSFICIFPDKCRIELLGLIKPKNLIILPNVLENKNFKNYVGNIDKDLKVFVCGWLDNSRGVELIESLLNKTDDNIKFILAGQGNMDPINNLLRSDRVKFLGLLSREKTMDLMSKVDLNFAFYNPSITINRYALPQKVSDSLSIGCPIIINSEVKMSKSLIKSGSAFSAKYWDSNSISKILMSLKKNKNLLKDCSKSSLEYNKKLISYEEIKNKGIIFYKSLMK